MAGFGCDAPFRREHGPGTNCRAWPWKSFALVAFVSPYREARKWSPESGDQNKAASGMFSMPGLLENKGSVQYQVKWYKMQCF